MCLAGLGATVLAQDQYHLIFGVALHDEGQFTPVGQTDGVTFAVQVESDKQTKEVFRRHVPKTVKKTTYSQVDLSAYAGKVIRVRFTVDPGPAGDATYDWGVWVDPRIVRGKLPPKWSEGDTLAKAESVKVIFNAIDSYNRAILGVAAKEGLRAGAVFDPAAFPVGWDVSAMPWPKKVCYGERVPGIFAQPAWDG
ncbi:MAG TPA: hypothetical protein VK968_15995, partial [Roseimicrobium sp.]|nr:hypothetical protein [Roseimicrobium sp.]